MASSWLGIFPLFISFFVSCFFLFLLAGFFLRKPLPPLLSINFFIASFPPSFYQPRRWLSSALSVPLLVSCFFRPFRHLLRQLFHPLSTASLATGSQKQHCWSSHLSTQHRTNYQIPMPLLFVLFSKTILLWTKTLQYFMLWLLSFDKPIAE